MDRRRLVGLVALVALVAGVLGACGDDAEVAEPGTDSATTVPAAAAATTRGLTDQYDARYCEVLGVTVGPEATTAEVWGTQGLNDCPAAGFATIDAATAATELGATIAIVNGPRYWVLDSIVANALAGSGETRTFGEVEMRSIAVVDLGPGLAERSAYEPSSVRRDTEFVYEAGREVHELTAPDGTVFVMQSYSVEVDPTLTADGLGAIGARLDLPPGWTYTSRVLADRVVVEDVDGVARVLQDDLRNSYQLVPAG